MDVQQSQTVLEMLEAMDARFSSPETWIKNQYSRDVQGKFINPNSEKAVCWCLVGCMMSIKRDYSTHAQVIELLRQILALDGTTRRGEVGLSCWNDEEARVFDDIKLLLSIAKQRAKEQAI